jgi:hypothetical protein
VAEFSETIRIFPNPTCDIVYISGLKHPATLDVYHVSGLPVYQNITIPSGTFKLSISKPGLYLFRITDKTGILERKVIIE